ncbi:2-polyprenyl-6-methoxyphenol hydroxylase [Zafaria cholistanensis]|uniref:2-polyprenyl-6-methoxyphenol hydroxylase n=1 Tax=Zafaria cholistanensis TaxID=1682741 RepID=A0A5A7NTA8_9MICC|nr:FAD-dependent monooxygenase [Zafaria cholistanensis]GER23392.1 2-polyprenyl-6-methoxyphenol hydroxylase [Zafaria cholistanensis]
MNTDVDVVVVGAGPTGLMAANWLARFGVEAVVIDRKSGPTRESRALAVQSRSMEIYSQLGVGAEVLARSQQATVMRPAIGSHLLDRVQLGGMGHGLTPFPGLYVLEQSANEEILAANLDRLGGQVLWNHAFVGLRQQPHPGGPGQGHGHGAGGAGADPGVGVVVEVEGPDGIRHELTARYVIAADGAGSPVRTHLGIGFQGATNDQTFFVIDGYGVEGLEPGISIRISSENFMLAFPMGAGDDESRYRLVGIIHPPARQSAPDQPGGGQPGGWKRGSGRPDGGDRDASGADGAAPEAAPPKEGATGDEQLARTMLLNDFGVRYAGSSWFSTYRVHHRVAATFRAGNVFLAGDAAHVHSPVGGQGMNTGLQDAHNLACKLADVIQGRMPPEYLDRYEAERRPVALRLVATTDRLFALVSSTTPAARFVRTRVLPVVWPALFRLLPHSPMRGRFAGYLGQFRIHYWLGEGQRQRAQRRHGSRRTTRRGRVLGRRLPWTGAPALEGGNAADNFAPLARAVWQVHAYGSAGSARARRLAAEHRMPMFRFPAAPARNLPDGTVVVVRPDGFVAQLSGPWERFEPDQTHR